MWNNNSHKNFPARGFSTPPPTWKSRPSRCLVMPMSERKPASKGDLFHVVHKVPAGDSPYVRAKQVQLIEKDPSRAISLFWAAINAGDRVDSALKDMAVVMKQLDRSDEAIEAIKSFRHLCPYDSQESLDNVLVELYKRSGRIEEEIEMLQHKLKQIEECTTFGGKRMKIARSQGKKIQITIEQEKSRIIGNLAWAYMQLNNYKTAEELYRKALYLEPDKNKQCNLAICLMQTNRIAEAKSLLQDVRASPGNNPMEESYARSFDRAVEMLTELESQSGSTSCKNLYASPTPVRRNLEVPFTQPRRYPWGGAWRDNAVGRLNNKLSFEQPMTPENGRAVMTIKNLKGDLLASNNEMSEVALLRSQEVYWKNEGCARKIIPRPVVNGDGKKDSWENDGQENFAIKESSFSPEMHMEPPIAANAQPAQDFLIYDSKKSWADMVEEEEQDLKCGRTDTPQKNSSNCFQTPSKFSDGWISEEDVYNDENLDSNIISQAHFPLNHDGNLSHEFESFNLEDRYSTSGNARNPVQRSLSFSQQQKQAAGYNNSAQANECDYTPGKNIKPNRRNRLQVFQDITLLPESPRD